MIFKDKSIWLEKIDTKSSKILGIDFGIKKVGLAIHYCNLNTSIPNKVLNEHSIHTKVKLINAFINSEEIDGIVIGMPVDYSTNEMTSSVIYNFGVELSKTTDKPIIFFDENFTSKLADRLLKQTNLKRKKRNKLDDSISAQIILDDFFKI